MKNVEHFRFPLFEINFLVYQASPGRAKPRIAMTATPRPASPRQSVPFLVCLASPRHAQPDPASPRLPRCGAIRSFQKGACALGSKRNIFAANFRRRWLSRGGLRLVAVVHEGASRLRV